MHGRRETWTFHYRAGDVAGAAQEMADYHRGRLAWWEKARDETIAEIRETGVTVEEHEVTGGVRAGIKIDTTLSERLSEAQAKMRSHKSAAAEFLVYADVLGAHPDTQLLLEVEDVRFFGLADRRGADAQ